MKTRSVPLFAAALAALSLASPALAAEGSKNLVETAVAAGKFQTLATALQKADLVATLEGPGPFTVFAPTDEAFAQLPKAQLDALLADPAKLRAVLLYHVVPGKVTAADALKLKDGTKVKTAGGPSLTVGTAGGNVTVDGVRVIQADVAAANGVIHVIDRVLLPPAK